MKFKNIFLVTATFASLLLILQSDPLMAANSVGGKCSKVGSKIRLGSIQFSCKKIGKKLIWVKDEIIVEDLGKDISVSPIGTLSSVNECKIADVTFDNPPGSASSGFPRSSNLPSASRNVRVLILPISFSDFKFDKGSYDLVNIAYQKVVKLYTSMSYGRVTVSPTFAAKDNWIEISSSLGESGLKDERQRDDFIRKVLAQYASTHSTSEYDIIDLVTKNDSPMYDLQINLAMDAGMFRYGTYLPFAATLNAGIIGRFRTHAHELAHAWLGLEDLYSFETLEKYLGGWDLLDGAGGITELSAWSRWLVGWVTDSQVRCVTSQKATTHFVSVLSANVSESKMIVSKISNSSALAVEVRGPTEFDQCDQTVLVYVVDTRYWSGSGPLRLRGTLKTIGSSITTDGITVTLNKINKNGALISLITV